MEFEKCSNASLVTYIMIFIIGVADNYSCMNGRLAVIKCLVLPDKQQYNSCWSQIVFIKALIIRRYRSFSFLQKDLSVRARDHVFLCKL